MEQTSIIERKKWNLCIAGILTVAGAGAGAAVRILCTAEKFNLSDVAVLAAVILLSMAALSFLWIIKSMEDFLLCLQRWEWAGSLSGEKRNHGRLEIRLYEIFRECQEAADRRYAAEILTKQAEIDALQSQINPHFLYNTLEAIRGRALEEDCGDIAQMAEALAGLFRYSISQKGDLVTLEDELHNLENYILIQQYRFRNKFNINYVIENRNLLSVLIPRMSIQPLIENAIYHGLETKAGKGCIHVKVIEYRKRIEICIEDNGTGIEQEKLMQLNRWLSERRMPKEIKGAGIGIALLNVNKRLELYFGEEYGLKIYSTPGYGTDVRITLPKEQMKNERRSTADGMCERV